MSNFIIGALTMAQINESSLNEIILNELDGRETFIDAEEIDDRIFAGDIFSAILEEDSERSNFSQAKLSDSNVTMLQQLDNDSTEYNYIQLIKDI